MHFFKIASSSFLAILLTSFNIAETAPVTITINPCKAPSPTSVSSVSTLKPSTAYSSSSSSTGPIETTSPVYTSFSISTYREGVPFLQRPVLLLPDGSLVTNDNYDQVLLTLNGQKLVSSSDPNKLVSILSTGAMALTNSDVANEPTGPWTIESTTKHLKLDGKSNAWSCPFGKSGVYHLFWTADRPAGQTGCLRVDLIANTV